MKGFEGLWASLDAGSEPLALVVGRGADGLVEAAASWRDIAPASVSQMLTLDAPDGWEHPERLLHGHRILIELDVLFWPTVMADPLRLLRSLSRHHSLVVHWPGQIANGRATYSEPGRRDYYDEPLGGEVVVRPRPISSPTDRSYDMEIFR